MILTMLARRKAAALTGLSWETQNIMKSSSLETVLLFTGFPKKVWAMIM
jgi:hypothetical protein